MTESASTPTVPRSAARHAAVLIPACLLALAPVNARATQTQPAGGAGQIAEQPCDPQYWKTLTAKAWLQAEREIIQNQNLIFKPDSVLEYTCFDRFLNHNALHAGNIFVHTGYFGKVIIPRNSNESMEKGLANVVLKSLKAYHDGSYKNSQFFLSGRANRITNKGSVDRYPGGDGSGGNDTGPAAGFPDVVVPSDYNCNVMQEIWKTSKCINFIDNQEFLDKGDGFYPFKDLKPVAGAGGANNQPVKGYQDYYFGANDPRQWPINLKCTGPEQKEWKDKVDDARNTAGQDDRLYPFKDTLRKVFKAVGDKTEPGKCQPPILTGVKVVITGGQTYDDGVCTNPGCTYRRTGSCE